MTLASTDAQTLRHVTGARLARLAAIVAMAGLLMAYAWLDLDGMATIWAMALGGTLLGVATLLFLVEGFRLIVAQRATSMLAEFFENDAAPSFVTNAEGSLLSGNPAARIRFQPTFGDTLAGTLRGTFADPGTLLRRLQQEARRTSSAREDIVTRHGPVRLSVQLLRSKRFLWRIEDVPEGRLTRRSAESFPLPMMTVSKTGAILSMNDAAQQLAGGRLTMLGGLFVDMPPRADEINLIRTSDGLQPFRLIEQPMNAGRCEMILLPESRDEDRFPGIDGLPVAMLRLSADGHILSSNAAAERLLGEVASKGHFIGDVMEGLGRPISDWLHDTTERRQSPKSEFLRLTREDRETFVQVTLSPVQHAQSDELIAVLNDATELKTLEAQFVQSQKMQAIGQLAGGVAHDFNNLLTAISGHCDLLLLRHDQADEDYADLMQINQNANRAASLVGQLLAFSRKQTLRPEILDVRDTLSDLTHLLNRLVGEKVTLALVHDPRLGAIRADKRQLEQVLMNLVVNARDSMPEGGKIEIVTEALILEEPLERDRARLPAGEYVLVKVIDQGVGIPSDKLQKVFEPFYTTKRTGEGTGLGLSTAYGIVKQTGGYIFVDSVVGVGTEFSLIFPVRKAAAIAPEPELTAQKRATPRHGEGVVLLVEDEAPVRAFASRALRLRGYTVIEAESAEAALAKLDDPDLAVDVFVTDVVMPGMDGPTWVRTALKARPDVRVVFMSGYAEGAFGDAQPDLPDAVFLQKPFSLSQLTDTVHDQLGDVVPPVSQEIEA